MSEDKIFDIAVECDGTIYKGWANPSVKLNDEGFPASFHVVLNETSFGYLSFSSGKWSADQQRPAELVDAVGEQIQQHYKIDQVK
jgi:hypothetical protein